MTEKEMYKQAVDEMNTDNFDQALWAMLWTKASGDENRAKALYIEARVREIKAEKRRVEKSTQIPLSQRIPWRLLGLFVCAATFAAFNDSVAREHSDTVRNLRWDFYLIGITGYALGLMLIPGVCLLMFLGHKWGYRVGFLMLGLGGCIAGVGGLPEFDYNKPTAVAMYFWMGFLVLAFWIPYAYITASRENKALCSGEK